MAYTFFADSQSEWFRDALLDLPPSSAKITLLATPKDSALPSLTSGVTSSSVQRRQNRAKVGSFSVLAEGDFGHTEVGDDHNDM